MLASRELLLLRRALHDNRASAHQIRARAAMRNGEANGRRQKAGRRQLDRTFKQIAAKAGVDLRQLDALHERDFRACCESSRAVEAHVLKDAVREAKRTRQMVRGFRKRGRDLDYSVGNPAQLICLWQPDTVDQHAIFEAGAGFEQYGIDRVGEGRAFRGRFETESSPGESRGAWEVHHHFSWTPQRRCIVHATAAASVDGWAAAVVKGSCTYTSHAAWGISQALVLSQRQGQAITSLLSTASAPISLGANALGTGCSSQHESQVLGDGNPLTHAKPDFPAVAGAPMDFTVVTSVSMNADDWGMARVVLGPERDLGVRAFGVWLRVEEY